MTLTLTYTVSLDPLTQKVEAAHAQLKFTAVNIGPHDSRFLHLKLAGSSPPAVRMAEELESTPHSTTCESQCEAHDNCCGGLSGPDSHPSCAQGCALAKDPSVRSLDGCYRLCDEADDSCTFTPAHSNTTIQMCGSCQTTPTCKCPPGWNCEGKRGTSLEQCRQGCIFSFGCGAL